MNTRTALVCRLICVVLAVSARLSLVAEALESRDVSAATTTTAGAESELEDEITSGSGGGGDQFDGSPTPEEIIKLFLSGYNYRTEREFPELLEKKWTYYTNVTEENRQIKVEAQIRITQFGSEARQTAQTYYHTYPAGEVSYDVRRQLEELASPFGLQAHTDVTEELEDVKSRMEQRYLTARVCQDESTEGQGEGSCLRLDPDLKRVMGESRDTKKLLWAWQGWRNETGAPSRGDFQKYVELSNIVAERSGFDDHGDYSRKQYGVENLESVLSDLFIQLKPLYQNLHALIRRRLYHIYGSDVIDLNGPIPAHLLGGMWSHSWSNLFNIAKLNQPLVGPTEYLKEQGYDVQRMFESAQEFYASMGFDALPESFWNASIIGHPGDGRDISCEPISWDFKDGRDYRVVTCTSNATIEGLSRIHNLLGHTYYQHECRSQPVTFREPANPAVFEAIADVTSSEVFGPNYLRLLGLTINEADDHEVKLNGMMRIALDSLALLPYALSAEQWRWGVFNGSITPEEYNSKWWELRHEYEGIVPPINRTEMDFDPGAEFHIVSDGSFLKYFLGLIMKFQFLKSLCESSGQEGPLEDCSLYGNRVAGQRLRAAMELGKSRSWNEIFHLITSQYDIDASAMLQYFQPLNAYLIEQNHQYGDSPGWIRSSSRDTLMGTPSTTGDTITSEEAGESVEVCLWTQPSALGTHV